MNTAELFGRAKSMPATAQDDNPPIAFVEGLSKGVEQGMKDALGSVSNAIRVPLEMIIETFIAINEEGADGELCEILHGQVHTLLRVMKEEGIRVPALPKMQ